MTIVRFKVDSFNYRILVYEGIEEVRAQLVGIELGESEFFSFNLANGKGLYILNPKSVDFISFEETEAKE